MHRLKKLLSSIIIPLLSGVGFWFLIPEWSICLLVVVGVFGYYALCYDVAFFEGMAIGESNALNTTNKSFKSALGMIPEMNFTDDVEKANYNAFQERWAKEMKKDKK